MKVTKTKLHVQVPEHEDLLVFRREDGSSDIGVYGWRIVDDETAEKMIASSALLAAHEGIDSAMNKLRDAVGYPVQGYGFARSVSREWAGVSAADADEVSRAIRDIIDLVNQVKARAESIPATDDR